MNFKLQSNQAILPLKKQELVAFIHDTFNTEPGHPVKLNRTQMTGRFITSLREYSEKPIETTVPPGWFPVVVEFPKSELSTSDRHFNFFSQERSEQINDYIQASFDLFFHVYFFDLGSLRKIDCGGEDEMELTKLHLVDSFIAGLKLVDVGSAADTIKKREYRREVEILTRKRQRFVKKEREFRRKIYEKRKLYIKNILNQ